MWESMTDIKNQIISMLNSDNDGLVIWIVSSFLLIFIRLHKAIIKFIEILVLGNNHQILLQQEQKDMIEKLIQFTLRYPSDNLITAIEALTNIARQRSDYVNRVVQTFETLNSNYLFNTLIFSSYMDIFKLIYLQIWVMILKLIVYAKEFN